MEMKFTSANFQSEVLEAEQPVLVDFFATWCGPCRMMGPVIEKLAEEYAGRVKVGKLDTDENGDIAMRYGVMTIPTIILFKGGKETYKTIGVQDIGTLRNAIDENL